MAQEKLALARENGITIWRCHDYTHEIGPDIIVEGVVDALAWQKHRIVPAGRKGARPTSRVSRARA